MEAAGAPGEATPAGAGPAAAARGLVTRRRVVLGAGVVLVAAMGTAYTQRSTYTDDVADLSRAVIGDENTARLEQQYFRVQDRVDRLKYRVLGGETNPFERPAVTVEMVPLPAGRVVEVDVARIDVPGYELAPAWKPTPMQPPVTHQLRDDPAEGEGVWVSAGLPRANPAEPLMLKTFLRPDRSRPYAAVGVLLVDTRRARLHITGGTEDPGGDRGVRGPGVIPEADVEHLLAAWNGGFKGPHGGFGMVADGKEYRPLRNGLATVCVDGAGVVEMGEYGSSITMEPGMVACRQNAVLLVKDGEVSKRVNEGNDTWGYVKVDSSEFITWRSAVGLTKDGHLLIASGQSLSAETLAQALWAAGAHTAMQLDINSPYVLTGLFFPEADGTMTAQRFMDSMPDTPSRYFKTQERDFMYLTLDEQRYRDPFNGLMP
ncbi:MAG: phosphodiester glycosidase family protein [Dehalococcoidia bacterium]|nr:phosphodiester glycosidase family protein [Dehalococcoidia bacterium]